MTGLLESFSIVIFTFIYVWISSVKEPKKEERIFPFSPLYLPPLFSIFSSSYPLTLYKTSNTMDVLSVWWCWVRKLREDSFEIKFKSCKIFQKSAKKVKFIDRFNNNKCKWLIGLVPACRWEKSRRCIIVSESTIERERRSKCPQAMQRVGDASLLQIYLTSECKSIDFPLSLYPQPFHSDGRREKDFFQYYSICT